MTRSLILALAVASVCVSATPDYAKAAQVEDQATGYTFGPVSNNLALSVRLEQQAVNAGAAVAITFAVKNFGPPISVFRFGSIREYSLTGTGPADDPIKEGGPGIPFSGSISEGVYVNTNQSYMFTVRNLGRAYDFQKPGRYVFSFKTAITLTYQAVRPQIYAVLQSNTVTLDVVK